MAKATSDGDFIEQLKASREKKTSGETLEERAAKINQDSHMIMNTPPPTTGVSRSDVLEKLKKEREGDTPNASDDGQKDTVVEVPDVVNEEPFTAPAAHVGEEVDIPVGMVDVSPYQPRLTIDEEKINALALAIQAKGQINAIIVRQVKDRYELVAGERRWRAMQRLGHKTIRAVIRRLSDADAKILAVTDNTARENLAEYELAKSIKGLIAEGVVKNQAEAAGLFGFTPVEVTRFMSFHRLPIEVMPLLDQRPGFLSARAASDFVPYMKSNDADLITIAIQKVFDEKLDVLSALNWLRGQSRARHNPSAPVVKQEYSINGRVMGEMRTEGRKVVITCAPGVSPDELINTILAGQT